MKSLPPNPPQCISAFAYKVIEREVAGIPVDAAFNCFEISCSCGSEVWRLMGNYLPNSTEFVGPLIAICLRCGDERRLIDLRKDGYNAQIGDFFEEDVNACDTWKCPACGTRDGSVMISVGYQYEQDSTDPPNIEDGFDTFIVTRRCNCSTIPIVVATLDCS